MKYESDRRSSPLFAPTPPREETEPPVCRRSERCKGCPHARHGFICWHRDGTCLKTDMAVSYTHLTLPTSFTV